MDTFDIILDFVQILTSAVTLILVIKLLKEKEK